MRSKLFPKNLGEKHLKKNNHGRNSNIKRRNVNSRSFDDFDC